jgi:tRNA-2-methylthio-N6-dimethylallyladenosine synthase
VQERFDRLVALQDDIAWSLNRELVGSTVEVLVSVGEGRKDADTHRMSGRARDGRLVHFVPSAGVRPGDVVQAKITYGAPHHLVADGPLISHRRTRAGDVFEAGRAAQAPGVGLGMPAFGAPGAAG